MKGKLAISLFFIIFLVIGLSGCLGTTHFKTISKQATIPYHSSSMLTGDAGTLYCRGLIKEGTFGVEYIELDWTADVVFPADSIMGYIDWGDTWGVGIDISKMPIMTPDGGSKWCSSKNLDTVWKMEMKIYRDDIYFWFHSTTHGVHDEFWLSEYHPERYFGYTDIIDGKHYIASFFASDECDCGKFECGGFDDYEIQIQTLPFKLVKDGMDFWFEY